MKPQARDYEGRTRNPVWERDLARQLRTLSEAERRAFFGEFLSVNQAVALDLARKCLMEKRSLEDLLARGLAEADASSMREWLECVMPRLGLRHVVRYLMQQRPANPSGVEKAVYWLPMFLGGSGCSREELNALSSIA